MAEHEHGAMDVTTHHKTFDGFIRMVTRVSIVIIVLVIFMALVNG